MSQAPGAQTLLLTQNQEKEKDEGREIIPIFRDWLAKPSFD